MGSTPFTLLAVIAALIIDLVLLFIWRRRNRPLRRPDIDAKEAIPTSAARIQITVKTTDTDGLQLTLQALAADEEPESEPQALVRIDLDAGLGELPKTIVLDPALKPAVPHRRLSPELVSMWARPLINRFPRARLRQLWERLKTSRLSQNIRSLKYSIDARLFLISLLVYALTRLIALEDFPIYFFTDEAVQTVLAEDLVKNGLYDGHGTLLPTYFENNSLFNLSLSVYAQVIPYILFGKSIFVTRATSALITLLAAAAVALALRNVFRIRFWWLGTLLLSITPAWFLHSRTAFETVLFVSMYTLMLAFYLLYLIRSPRFFYAAVLFAGLAFYSYSGGQLIIAGTALLLFLSDLRHHWQNRRTIGLSLILAVLLILPYVRFQMGHEGETYYHLRMLGTYWLHDIPLGEKIGTFLGHYFFGLSPVYWYSSTNPDLSRHIMQGYGHIMLATLPFMLIGLAKALKNWRSSEYRLVLAACLAAPLGAAIVGVGITRVLVFVIPATFLTTIGMSSVGNWIASRRSYKIVAYAITVLLVLINAYMLRDALVNGAFWDENYGLYGMQYGAKQVFDAVKTHINESPQDTVFVSPSWANGTHILRNFFSPYKAPVYLGNADRFLLEKGDLNEKTILVLTREEYDNLLNDEKVTDIRIERTVPYPNGRVGFLFIRMRYAPGADAIFAREYEDKLRPVTEEIELGGQTIAVQHPQFDMGELIHIFDGDPFTLVRTYHANPALITLTFDHPQTISGIKVTTGTMQVGLNVRLYQNLDSDPQEYSRTYRDLPNDPTVDLPFHEGPIDAIRIEVEILGVDIGDNVIHIRDLMWYE
ncbi:MAG: hypothetical protein GTO14_01345 [Anaerolineales bacterium]|nr:hypothetical protein [Anaerolineales bacterium]